jgi:hypothetical protein
MTNENERTEDVVTEATNQRTGKLTLAELVEDSGDELFIIAGVLSNEGMTAKFNKAKVTMTDKFEKDEKLMSLADYKKAKQKWFKKKI